MKNFAAKLFLALMVISGLASLSFGSGSIVRYFTVGGFDSDTHSVYFAANTTVYIRATGDGTTDLDMYVTNANDELIVSDVRESTDGYVKFTTRRGGNYYIEVDNNGSIDNYYRLEVTY